MAGAGTLNAQRSTLNAQGGMPAVPMEFRREVAGLDPANNPIVRRFAGGGMAPTTAPAVPQDQTPRLFVDSDGRARAGFNMGGEAGLVPADRSGVPIGMEMVPVTGLSQGSMEIGIPQGTGRRFALAPEAGPATPESYARAVNAVGGYQAPPMNAREAALQGDRDLTRTNRWSMEGGPTSAMNRRSQAMRSQGAALDALTRQTDEQIRGAQGTPQAVASGAGVASYTPRADGRGPGEWTETVRPERSAAGSSVVRHPGTGMTYDQAMRQYLRASPRKKGQFNPMAAVALALATDDQQREQIRLEMDQDDPGNPEALRQLEPIMQWFQQNGMQGAAPAAAVPAVPMAGSAAPGAGAAIGRPAAAGGADPLDEFRRK
jgi:hypothetical protein